MMRGSGITSRMLLRAILAASEGEQVLVTAYSNDYAKDLMMKTIEVVSALLGYHSFDITNHKISIHNGGSMTFTAFRGGGISQRHFRHIEKTYTKRFDDHYEGRYS